MVPLVDTPTKESVGSSNSFSVSKVKVSVASIDADFIIVLESPAVPPEDIAYKNITNIENSFMIMKNL